MPRAAAIGLAVLLSGTPGLAAQEPKKNIWEEQYKTRTPEAMAAEFESATRAVFRYRVAIVGLMELKPGMTAADIGAGSGFLARLMAEQVGATGKVIATELDRRMVDYMDARAQADGLRNFSAVQGQATSTGLAPRSVDAVALVNVLSFFDRPREMLESIAESLKPGGLMLVVDLPREGQGTSETGMDADEVVALATKAGFARVNENGIVPGHYAIRFRKPEA
jgi:ubiquinone/menaquinone biosynthesis C-methylase UbiE